MRNSSLFFFFLVIVGFGTCMNVDALEETRNDRPIIGILELPYDEYQTGQDTHFPACYVKWIESAGARVVPIRYDLPKERLQVYFKSLNGILFTGGGLNLDPKSIYFQTAQLFWNWAIEENDKGVHFPLWGTCMGFQLLSILAGGQNVLEAGFDSRNLPLPLYFTSSAKQSSIISQMPIDIYNNFRGTDNITINHHRYSVPNNYYNSSSALGKFFNLVAWNKDRNGRPFGSMIQARKYPFYGTQYHGERNAFEWDKAELVSHTPRAIKSMQWLINFFVDSARKNSHSFSDLKDEERCLIYQYNPKYTGDYSDNVSDEQTYVFKPRSF